MLKADVNNLTRVNTIPSPSTKNEEINLKGRMQLAINAVMHKGETPTCAARKWQLNRTAILHNLLREKKLQQDLGNNVKGEANAMHPKLFQSKFTSKQLLSARQEESLANYLKQCYEMQWQHNSNKNNFSVIQEATQNKPPLLCEEVARSLAHNFVHMHKLKYPGSWDAKQQAAADWFNGFVDRNPEVIECVAPSTKERKQRKRTIKLEASATKQTFGVQECVRRVQNDLLQLNEEDVIESDKDNILGHDSKLVPDIENVRKFNCNKEFQSSQIPIKIKVEPIEEADSIDVIQQNKLFRGDDNINIKQIDDTIDDKIDIDEVIMMPEVVYHTNEFLPKASGEHLPPASIAESVKRRTMRKPRIFAEHLYAAEINMESDKNSCARQRHQTFTIKKPTTSSHIKIPKQQNFYEQGHYDNEEHHLVKSHQRKQTWKEKPTHCAQTQSLDNLKESIEKMHSDMNYLMQSMLMEMTENNRLLRRLITTNENNR